MRRQSRKPKGKMINPTFFVFCEGETEEAYIRFLRATYRLPIVIDAKIAGNRITNMYIANYKKTKDTHPKDKTYLVYDLDVAGMQERLQSLHNAILIGSNPCFELWYLLHNQDQKAALTSSECLQKLNSIFRNYRKGHVCDKLKEKLRERQSKAIERAKKIIEYKNPSTRVYQLIEDLDGVKNSE